MRSICIALILQVAFLYIGISQESIIMDDRYTDWNDQLLSDDAGDVSGGMDIKRVGVSDSEEYVYFTVETDAELKLYDEDYSPESITLFIDLDNNPNTGKSIADLGAELEIALGERLFYYHSPDISNWDRFISDLGFTVAPTTTGVQFEFAFRKDVEINGQAIFDVPSFSFVMRSSGGDLAPDNSLNYTWNSIPTNYQAIDILDIEDLHLRFMAHNTLQEGLGDEFRHPSFERLYRTIDPSIVVFNESDLSTSYVEGLLDDWIGGSWTAIQRNSRSMIGSKFPILDSEFVSYRITAALVDLPNDEYDGDVVVIAIHAPCCGNDTDRQVEADRFANYMLRLKSGDTQLNVPENTPVVMMGDLNLVGYRQQLETFLTGDIEFEGTFGEGGPLDWDGTSLKDALILNSELPNYHTWDGDNGPWPDGKLDFIIYTDSRIEQGKAFTLNTDDMPPARLQELGLQYYDSYAASDHYPVVADLKLMNHVLVSNKDEEFVDFQVHSPASDLLTFTLEEQLCACHVSIFDVNGKNLVSVFAMSTGADTFQIELGNLVSGLYYIHLRTSDGKVFSRPFAKI